MAKEPLNTFSFGVITHLRKLRDDPSQCVGYPLLPDKLRSIWCDSLQDSYALSEKWACTKCAISWPGSPGEMGKGLGTVRTIGAQTHVMLCADGDFLKHPKEGVIQDLFTCLQLF